MKEKVLILGDFILDINYVLKEKKCVNSEIAFSHVVHTKKAYFGGVGRIVDAFINGLKYPNYTLITVIEQNYELDELLSSYTKKGMCRNHIYTETDWVTPTKVRFYKENETFPFLRVDKESDNKSIDETLKLALFDEMSSGQYGALLLCDYGKGTISAEVYDYILSLRKKFDFLLMVDTKYKKEYRNCDILKTNIDEFNAEWCTSEERAYSINDRMISVASKYEISNVIVTQNKEGAIVYSGGSVIVVPTVDAQKKSYIGAGDHFTAAFIKEYLNDSSSIKSMVKVACQFASIY